MKQGSVVTMSQPTNQPVVGGPLTGRTRLICKLFHNYTNAVTMRVEDTDKQLKFEVRATGLPKEMELVDANGSVIAVFLPTEGSIPSQMAAFSSSGQANGAGEKLLTLTKTRVVNRHTDLDMMTMKGLEQHNSFVKPLVHAGVAYKMKGSWSGRSIVVREVGTMTVIAEMSPGADKDSFIVDVHPSANTVFVVTLFAIANAMKGIGIFEGASPSFGLAIAGHIVAGVASDLIGGCVGDACAEGGFACCC